MVTDWYGPFGEMKKIAEAGEQVSGGIQPDCTNQNINRTSTSERADAIQGAHGRHTREGKSKKAKKIVIES